MLGLITEQGPRLAETSDQLVTAPTLEARGISKSFDGVHALTDVSVTFEAGEVHALVGENGAGKSTLVKVISGVHVPDAGQLVIAGDQVAFADPRAAMATGIAVVYQEPSLLPDLTVEENLVLGHEPKGPLGVLKNKEIRATAERYLEAVGGGIHPGAPVARLTIAERQLVEIAKALSRDARLVLMDEPTSSLSIREVGRLEEVVRRLKANRVSVVFISHDLAEVFAISDRITVLKDGRVTLVSPTADTTVDQVVRSMVGRDLAHLFPTREPPSEEGEVVLEVRDLTVPGRAEDVSFDLRAGEVTGFVGLIGAGRTDVAKAVIGADRPRSGTIRFRGDPLRARQPADSVKLGIGLVPEDRHAEGLVLDLPISQNISLPQLDRLSKWGFFDRRRERKIAREQIDSLGIRTPSEETHVTNLSGGNQQKVVLSKWLARGCQLLVLDEPTRGVDVGAKVEIYELVRSVAASGAAVMLISSELPEILHLSDRIVVMSKGRIVANTVNSVYAEGDMAMEEQMVRAALEIDIGQEASDD